MKSFRTAISIFAFGALGLAPMAALPGCASPDGDSESQGGNQAISASGDTWKCYLGNSGYYLNQGDRYMASDFVGGGYCDDQKLISPDSGSERPDGWEKPPGHCVVENIALLAGQTIGHDKDGQMMCSQGKLHKTVHKDVIPSKWKRVPVNAGVSPTGDDVQLSFSKDAMVKFFAITADPGCSWNGAAITRNDKSKPIAPTAIASDTSSSVILQQTWAVNNGDGALINSVVINEVSGRPKFKSNDCQISLFIQ